MNPIYRRFKRLTLFLKIVWRKWDETPDGRGIRVTLGAAWKVSHDIWMS